MASDNLGALWEKDSAKGKFFTGVLEVGGEKIKIVVFKNNMKKSDKSPDWNILRGEEKGEPAPTKNEPNDIPF